MEPRNKTWGIRVPIQMKIIQLILSKTRWTICRIKNVKVRSDFCHINVYVKHEVVSLFCINNMSSRSSNSFARPLEHTQISYWTIIHKMVPRDMSIDIVDSRQILTWEICNLFCSKCLSNTPLNSCFVPYRSSKFFSFSFLTIHPPKLHRSSYTRFPR